MTTIRWLLSGLLFLAPVCIAAQPNILFILTDDQRYDEVGFLNPILQTPHMDELASRGVHFKNAFVTTALCSPSRASILTGQMMHNHGVIDNNRPLPEGLELFPSRLRNAGYETAFIGKWHMGGQISAPRPEFDYWVSFPGQGTYYPQNLMGMTTVLNVNGKDVQQQGYITDELTDYALEFLNARDESKPFFLYLSHKAVHATFEPAARHAEQYADADIVLGKPSAESKDVPLWVQNQRNSWHGDEFPYHSELPLQEFKREYHRTLSAVDDSLGRLTAWLTQHGLLDNTVVVLMGDNGFLFGEHGLIDKRNAYEESMRVPLLVAAPDLYPPGQIVEQMVANIDLAPTFLTLAGAATPSHYDGRSFAHLPEHRDEGVEGEAPPWRNTLTYEYYWEFNYPQTPTVFALRGERYKYIQYHGVWDTEELFDLQQDPEEAVNLIEDEALLDVKVRMRQELYASLSNRDGANHIPYSAKFNQGAVFRHPDRSKAAEYSEKWLRRADAPDRWEHVVPDGPEKAARMKVIGELLKDR